jgi:hypothetical protein
MCNDGQARLKSNEAPCIKSDHIEADHARNESSSFPSAFAA